MCGPAGSQKYQGKNGNISWRQARPVQTDSVQCNQGEKWDYVNFQDPRGG